MTRRCRFQANHNTSPNAAWTFPRFTTPTSVICSLTDRITKSLTTKAVRFTLKTRLNSRSSVDMFVARITRTKRVSSKYTRLNKKEGPRSTRLGTFQRTLPRGVTSLRTPRVSASCEWIKSPERIKEVLLCSPSTPTATVRRAICLWYIYTNWRSRPQMSMRKSRMVTMEDNSIIVLKMLLVQRRGIASNLRWQESSRLFMNLPKQAWSSSLRIILRARWQTA